MTYNPDNIFAKILRGDIPNNTVYEDDYVLCFDDIYPKAAIHCLIIPKAQYISLADFSATAGADEITAFHRAIDKVIEIKGVRDEGFRAICNTGDHGGQEVPHFHMHILAGEKLPPL